ncbi:protein of unknown function [Methylorubrum extorquens]|uniref:Uncharacterized protein n=1 Tax=Methylorubrum extorquens TaxID=408 RepID=A0A2N9AMH3_METEX|nr:protein of unknown function [Methylorubrum extorquens]
MARSGDRQRLDRQIQSNCKPHVSLKSKSLRILYLHFQSNFG